MGATIGKAVKQATGEKIQTNEAKTNRTGSETKREASTLGQRKRVSKHKCTKLYEGPECECASVRVCECASVQVYGDGDERRDGSKDDDETARR